MVASTRLSDCLNAGWWATDIFSVTSWFDIGGSRLKMENKAKTSQRNNKEKLSALNFLQLLPLALSSGLASIRGRAPNFTVAASYWSMYTNNELTYDQ
jgi:hypothetical protein